MSCTNPLTGFTMSRLRCQLRRKSLPVEELGTIGIPLGYHLVPQNFTSDHHFPTQIAMFWAKNLPKDRPKSWCEHARKIMQNHQTLYATTGHGQEYVSAIGVRHLILDNPLFGVPNKIEKSTKYAGDLVENNITEKGGFNLSEVWPQWGSSS